MEMALQLVFLLFGSAAACDAGLDWGEKNSSRTSQSFKVDRSAWPKSMREIAERKSPTEGPWPFGADATSFSATVTWEKMAPDTGGNVFVSNFLNEGCGSGYVGAQMHYNSSTMYADWAIWDVGPYTTAIPVNNTGECVRYDGEGHGTQCGVLPVGPSNETRKWEIGTPYIFNVSLVGSNASGAHFAGFIQNNRTGEVYKLGEIFTKIPPKGSYNCSRLMVGSSPFQEIYAGGNFTNIVSVEGPVFRGVEGHPSDVVPTGGEPCYYHHSCYGKDGPANCRNESSSFCSAANCSVAKTTFVSGHTPVPPEYIPPWDKQGNVVLGTSTDCWFAYDTGLAGGYIPERWGEVIMNVIWPQNTWIEHCCASCLADPDCLAARLYGDQCTLHHNSSHSGAITPQKHQKGLTALIPMKTRSPGMPGLRTLLV